MNNLFDQIPFFAISKMAKIQFLNWENCQKCNFTKKKIDLFDFTSFCAWTFYIFWPAVNYTVIYKRRPSSYVI